MAILLLEDKSISTINLLIELAKKLGVKTQVLSDADIDDVKLGQLMAQERTGKYVSEDEVLYKLTKK
jgi:hypothetical protein